MPMLVHNRTSLEMLNQLKTAKYSQGLTYRELSKAAGIPQQTLTKKLNGRAPMSVQQLFNICNALKISPSELVKTAETVSSTERRQAETGVA